MDEVNGYRKLMLFVSLYDDDVYRDKMEKRIFRAIEPLEIFNRLFDNATGE